MRNVINNRTERKQNEKVLQDAGGKINLTIRHNTFVKKKNYPPKERCREEGRPRTFKIQNSSYSLVVEERKQTTNAIHKERRIFSQTVRDTEFLGRQQSRKMNTVSEH